MVLEEHLKRDKNLSCLCMHHLHYDRFAKEGEPFRFCVVHNPDAKQYYGMVNPAQVGGSNRTILYKERSVSCPVDHWQERQRREIVIMHWNRIDLHESTPRNETGMYFKGLK